MKRDNTSFYTSGLRWAFNKGSAGFTEDDIKNELSLDEEGWALFQWIFMSPVNGIAPLIWKPATEDLTPKQKIEPSRYYLTAAGVSAYNEHVELEEAKRGGRNALILAIIAIVVSALFGIAGIYYETKGTFQVQDSTSISNRGHSANTGMSSHVRSGIPTRISHHLLHAHTVPAAYAGVYMGKRW